MQHANLWVDEQAHLLHMGGRTFPCSREIVCIRPWNHYALLLSADTDHLSLWDKDGLVRTTPAGVYPQDMAISGDNVCICGSADGKLHLLSLPDLQATAAYPLPGMPERICIHRQYAWILSLLPDPEIHTALFQLEMSAGTLREVARFPGIPGALAADDKGLWTGVSDLVVRIPWNEDRPDIIIEEAGMPSRIDILPTGAIIVDTWDNRQLFIRT